MKKLLFIFGFALLAFGCSSPKNSINLYNWTYYIPDSVLMNFQKDMGIKVNLDTYDSNETMYAKLATGNAGFDITVPSGDYVSIMKSKGMLSKIDKNLIPNLALVEEDVTRRIKFDLDNEYSVPYFMGATGIHVNTSKIKDYEESWTIYNTTHKASMMNDMRDVLGAALLTLGYSVNTTSPEELQKAKELVLQWKANIVKFDSETFGKDFASGNLDMVHGFAEVVLKELEGNDTVNHKFFIPKEGSPVYIDSLVILENSKNKDNAHSFINYILDPKVHASIADEFFYPTIIKGASEFKKTKSPYTIKEVFEKGGEIKEDVGDSLEIYNAIWEEILSSK